MGTARGSAACPARGSAAGSGRGEREGKVWWRSRALPERRPLLRGHVGSRAGGGGAAPAARGLGRREGRERIKERIKERRDKGGIEGVKKELRGS